MDNNKFDFDMYKYIDGVSEEIRKTKNVVKTEV